MTREQRAKFKDQLYDYEDYLQGMINNLNRVLRDCEENAVQGAEPLREQVIACRNFLRDEKEDVVECLSEVEYSLGTVNQSVD